MDLTHASDVKIIIDLTDDPSPEMLAESNKHDDLDLPRWITVRKSKEVPELRWMGLDRGDGCYRLYQEGRIETKRHQRGRLMTSFSKEKLLRIAWDIGVFNPDSFGKSECRFWGVTCREGFNMFVTGWERSSKNTIIQYIWNTLEDNDEILFW